MVLCKQMTRELTHTTKRDSSDSRTACFDFQADSKLSPHCPDRVGESNLQGARSASPRIGRNLSTTVAAPQPGGAFQSKWTRRSRPWNASVPATVVASLVIETRQVGPPRLRPNHPPFSRSDWHDYGVAARGAADPAESDDSMIKTFSGGEEPETVAGRSFGEPRQHAGRKASRIHGSPVRD